MTMFRNQSNCPLSFFVFSFLMEFCKTIIYLALPVASISGFTLQVQRLLDYDLPNLHILLQDKDMRYRFIFNHFPSLGEQVIILSFSLS